MAFRICPRKNGNFHAIVDAPGFPPGCGTFPKNTVVRDSSNFLRLLKETGAKVIIDPAPPGLVAALTGPIAHDEEDRRKM